MRRLLVLVVVLILIGAAAWAQSNFGTGQWLVDLWKSFQKPDKDTYDFANAKEYGAFVLGAGSVMVTVDWIVFVPNTTYGQWFAIVGKYLDNHPEQWNLQPQVLVYLALSAVWPGKAKPTGL